VLFLKLNMSKLRTLFNRVLVFVLFVLTGVRVAVARILPASQSSRKPPSAKVFALTEVAWLELRVGGDGANQGTKSDDDKKKPSKSSDDKKEPSKSGDDKKEPSKSRDDSKEQSKSSDCDKGGSKSGDDQKGDASKSGECGPGGGDGDTGGTGG